MLVDGATTRETAWDIKRTRKEAPTSDTGRTISEKDLVLKLGLAMSTRENGLRISLTGMPLSKSRAKASREPYSVKETSRSIRILITWSL
jgi:hypothetical protein